MQEGIKTSFNKLSAVPPKVPKTETGIKVGQRRDEFGGTMFVRGGKVMNNPRQGLIDAKQRELREAADKANAERREQAAKAAAPKPPKM